jgi:hypothetical protein
MRVFLNLRTIERFSNFCGVTQCLQGGFFLKKKPLEDNGFPLHPLENRFSQSEITDSACSSRPILISETPYVE